MNYPNLSDSKMIAVDIETYDPELIESGTGVYRQDGHILGVSLSTDSGFTEYYNLGHKGINFEEKTKNLNYIREILSLPIPKLGANFLYDLDWLINGYDLKVSGKWNDVQIAEPLIDENRRSYSLDNLSIKYTGQGKEKSEIETWCEARGLKGDARKHLWDMPYEVVRAYAKGDAMQTFQVFNKQLEILKEEELLELYQMEIDLLPVLLQMRKTGVRLDVRRLHSNISYVQEQISIKEKALFKEYGEFNPKSGDQLGRILDRMGIEYPRTEKGNPNLDTKSLSRIKHPFGKAVVEVRGLKTSLAFLTNSFNDKLVGDRIHCNFNPLKSDDSGTVSGRFSSTNPNLQQVTKVDDKAEDMEHDLGVLARGCFIPEEGHLWGKIDYMQHEYRFMAHYAEGPGSDTIRKAYIEDPKTDYHAWVMSITGLDRKRAKNLNFGVAYFMGAGRMSDTFGWELEDSQNLLKMYHNALPFIRYTANQVIKKAQARDTLTKGKGYIKTILGRKARISDEMRKWHKEYTLFNRLIQGSSADMMKKAMVESYKAGLFEELKLHITVHDELDFSFKDDSSGREAYRELKRIMETCVKLKVPVLADAEAGEDWAHVKKIEL